MSIMKAQRKRRRGRPRGGADGQRIRDYPAILVRVPPRTRRIVLAAAKIMGKPIRQVVTDMAFYYQYAYLANNQPDIYARIESLVSQSENPATRRPAKHGSRPS